MSLLTQFYDCGGSGDVPSSESIALGMLGSSPLVFYDKGVPNRAFAENQSGGGVVGIVNGTNYWYFTGGSAVPNLTSYGFRKAIGRGPLNWNNTIVNSGGVWSLTDLEVLANVGLQNTGFINTVTLTINASSLTTLYAVGIAATTGLGFTCDSSPNLTTVSNFYASVDGSGPLNVSIQNAALTVASVEDILFALDKNTNANIASGTLNLQGGTSAGAGALSPAGTAAVTSLQAKGMTVLLRP